MTVIHGKFLDVTNAPAVGEVQIWSYETRASLHTSNDIVTRQIFKAPLDSDGYFESPDLNPGTLKVIVRAGGAYDEWLIKLPATGKHRLWDLVESEYEFEPGFLSRAVEAARKAEESAGNAKSSEQRADKVATKADEVADKANQVAQTANNAVTQARNSATQANRSATQAGTRATTAQQAVTQAQQAVAAAEKARNEALEAKAGLEQRILELESRNLQVKPDLEQRILELESRNLQSTHFSNAASGAQMVLYRQGKTVMVRVVNAVHDDTWEIPGGYRPYVTVGTRFFGDVESGRYLRFQIENNGTLLRALVRTVANNTDVRNTQMHGTFTWTTS